MDGDSWQDAMFGRTDRGGSMGEVFDDHRGDGRGAAARVGVLSTEPRREKSRASRRTAQRSWKGIRHGLPGFTLLVLYVAATSGAVAIAQRGTTGVADQLLPATGLSQPAATPRTASVVDPILYCRLSRFDVHDGDTLEDATILLPYDQTYWGRGIRVDGFDAWESDRTRQTIGEITPAELVKGARATAEARECLTQADAVYVQAGLRARFTYERLLAKVWFDPPGPDCTLVNFGDWMRERGHARPTDPVLEKEANARRKSAAKKVSEALFRAK
jgi:hypothetical protein